MTTYEAEAPVVIADPNERLSAKVLRTVTKLPVHLFLLFIGALWLVPTVG